MLVLTRKAGESIIIANNVRVKVIEVTSGGVKIGIEAPRDVSIVRAELHQDVENENRRSLRDGPLPEGLVSHLRDSAGTSDGADPRKDGSGDPVTGDGRTDSDG